jgi:hypothetical protein
MYDEIDVYISRYLKNWSAKYRPPADGKLRLLRSAGYPPVDEVGVFSHFFTTFANRWSSPGEQLYSQRHWGFIGPYNQSISLSFHLVTQQKMAQ